MKFYPGQATINAQRTIAVEQKLNAENGDQGELRILLAVFLSPYFLNLFRNIDFFNTFCARCYEVINISVIGEGVNTMALLDFNKSSFPSLCKISNPLNSPEAISCSVVTLKSTIIINHVL